MLDNKISEVHKSFSEDLKSVSNTKDIEDIRIKYFSRNGLISQLFETLKDAPKDEKPELGKKLNLLRNDLTNQFDALKENIDSKSDKTENTLDLTLPGKEVLVGSKHILTQTLDEIKSIFKGLGFSVVGGPELESDYYNFEALNFPADHPARDMQDTFFVSKDFLLRTHTTPVQIRIMEKQAPPVRAIMPGRVYRNEAVSARSYCMFHQVDLVLLRQLIPRNPSKGFPL